MICCIKKNILNLTHTSYVFYLIKNTVPVKKLIKNRYCGVHLWSLKYKIYCDDEQQRGYCLWCYNITTIQLPVTGAYRFISCHKHYYIS